MLESIWPPLFLLTLGAAVGSACGVWMGGIPAFSRRMVPFSGGLLLGVTTFWTFPELAEVLGWATAGAWLAGGVATLWAVDRWVYSVCPSCSHSHDHGSCATRLHGFAAPLVLAGAIHSFLEGWSIAAAKSAPQADLGWAVLASVAAHKLPEALALGIVLSASLSKRATAFAACVLVQCCIFGGALLSSLISPGLNWNALHVILAVAAGTFAFLGFHAVHSEWKLRGSPAFMPALTGAAGAAALQQGLRALLR